MSQQKDPKEDDPHKPTQEGQGTALILRPLAKIELSSQERADLYEMLSQRVTLPAHAGTWGEHETQAFLQQLETWLAKRLRELLDKQPEQAFQALYRVDVPEAQVHDVMGRCGPAMWPEVFARLVVARQLEKLETRRQWQERFAPSSPWSE
ncbi:MAG: hypothetical protein H6728_06955 [Myxococcales bacterium]|nr:hypothetical protein [Myxococcales bacterium]